METCRRAEWPGKRFGNSESRTFFPLSHKLQLGTPAPTVTRCARPTRRLHRELTAPSPDEIGHFLRPRGPRQSIVPARPTGTSAPTRLLAPAARDHGGARSEVVLARVWPRVRGLGSLGIDAGGSQASERRHGKNLQALRAALGVAKRRSPSATAPRFRRRRRRRSGCRHRRPRRRSDRPPRRRERCGTCARRTSAPSPHGDPFLRPGPPRVGRVAPGRGGRVLGRGDDPAHVGS